MKGQVKPAAGYSPTSGVVETIAFARRVSKSRRQRQLQKAARKKNR